MDLTGDSARPHDDDNVLGIGGAFVGVGCVLAPRNVGNHLQPVVVFSF